MHLYRRSSHVERPSRFEVDKHTKTLENVEATSLVGNDEHLDESCRWFSLGLQFPSDTSKGDATEGANVKKKYE